MKLKITSYAQIAPINQTWRPNPSPLVSTGRMAISSVTIAISRLNPLMGPSNLNSPNSPFRGNLFIKRGELGNPNVSLTIFPT